MTGVSLTVLAAEAGGVVVKTYWLIDSVRDHLWQCMVAPMMQVQ